MNTQILEKFGLSHKEAVVYVDLLTHGRMTPAELASTTQIIRPTIYSVCKELVKKGLVVEDLGTANRTFVARKPENVLDMLEREQYDLDRRKQLGQKIVQELQTLQSSQSGVTPKMVFVPEVDIEAHLYRQTPVWNASMQKADGIYWGYQDHTFVEQYAEWIDWYWAQTPKNVSLNLFTNDREIEAQMKERQYERRHMKFWNEKEPLTSSTWIMGDYVCMIVTSQPLRYLIEIHDAMIAENYRMVVRALWGKA